MSLEDQQDAIDEYMSALYDVQRFQGVVHITLNAEVVYSRGYGYAEVEQRKLNTTTTVYPIGSLTKQFTAAAVLQLMERGIVYLDAPLGKYIPASRTISELSIRQLLTHTSGLPTEGIEAPASKLALADFVELQKDVPLSHPPGTQFLYSNLGYFFLAYVVEKSSGQAFCRYVAQHIFELAGMRDARCCDIQPVDEVLCATGYTRKGNTIAKREKPNFSSLVGAGNVCMTAEDLAAWSIALDEGTVLNRSIQMRMFSRPIKGQSYGYGVIVEQRNGRRLIRHNGALQGFRSMFLKYPDDGLTVVILANLEPVPLKSLQEGLTAILFGERQLAQIGQKFDIVPVTPSIASQIIGRYRIVGHASNMVSVAYREGHIILKDQDGDVQHLMPTTKIGVFLVVETEESIDFEIRQDEGAERAIYHTIEGWDAELKRIN